MNEKQVYFESHTASKVTNRGSKICVNPFSEKRAKITEETNT